MNRHGVWFRSVIETTPDVILVMNADGVIVSANPALEQVLGYHPDEVTGKRLSIIMPERYREQH
ncbi:MAG TPA: PAS domain S-box protein, partial [Gemmatimonadaceae bacterium]|nr:PAS domain S-box protein [Gemmatimonadaceae bacterium]